MFHRFGKVLLQNRPLVAGESIDPPKGRLVLLALGAILLLAAACDGNNSPGPPTASAGEDQSAVILATVSLDGTGSSASTGFTWSQSSGTAVTLSDITAAAPIFRAPATEGELVFSLTVNNGGADSAPDTVTITVIEVPDPLFADQWHLSNTGQAGGSVGEDAAVLKAWDTQGVFGAGVLIAVVDDGLEIGHEDLAANVVSGSYEYLTGGSDPTGGRHGTSVAGVAAGVGFNGIGVAGAAPRAELVGYNVLQNLTFVNEADAMTRNASAVFISNNSWGPVDFTGQLAASSSTWKTAVQTGIGSGRGGKGIIYVWAAGNGHAFAGGTPIVDNSNHDGYANSPYVVNVCAVGDDGIKASYSEKGANLMVCAPSMGRGNHAITTVDRSGAGGYNTTGSSPNVSDTNYTNTFNGTSSAAPLAAGVIALMLEANPSLTWRDVRLLLAQNARKNDNTDPDWTTNGAGLNINHKYGFGVVDANAMVTAAKAYTTYLTGDWSRVPSTVSSPGTVMTDLGTATNTITVTGSGIINIEFVQVLVKITDSDLGDLEITLKAPTANGSTGSILYEPHVCVDTAFFDENCFDTLISGGFLFGTNRHMNEVADGDWMLTVDDTRTGEGVATFTSWQLIFYGR